MKVDIVAFGAHPDDVELGCAGSILAAVASGKSIGVVDLTQANSAPEAQLQFEKRKQQKPLQF